MSGQRQDIEDALEAVISDSFEMDWRPRDAARAIMSQLPDIGLTFAVNASILVPSDCGAFKGDVWFGDSENRTTPTHQWDGECWRELPALLRTTGEAS